MQYKIKISLTVLENDHRVFCELEMIFFMNSNHTINFAQNQQNIYANMLIVLNLDTESR